MSLRRFTAAAAAAAALAGALLISTAGCSRTCAGQCGPPYELSVMFRPGITTQAATAALNKCAADPVVERIGRLKTGHRSGGLKPPDYLFVYIYTRSASQPQAQALLTCLQRSPAVNIAGFPG